MITCPDCGNGSLPDQDASQVISAEEMVLRERERCAQVAEIYAKNLRNGGAINACRSIAKAIRSWSIAQD